MEKVTIRDIALVAGVSAATVSRALGGNSSVSEDTKRRIWRISEEMGYSPNNLSLKPKSLAGGVVGLLLPNLRDPEYAAIARAVKCWLQERDISLIARSSDGKVEEEAACFDDFAARKVDGVIFVPSSQRSHKVLFPKLEQIQTVFLGENLMDTTQSFVAADDRRGAMLAVEYLAGLGFQELTFLDDGADTHSRQLMAEGFCAACTKHNVQGKVAFSKEVHGTTVIAPDAQSAGEAIRLGAGAVVSLREVYGAENEKPPFVVFAVPVEKLARIACEMLLDQLGIEIDGYSHRLLMPVLFA